MQTCTAPPLHCHLLSGSETLPLPLPSRILAYTKTHGPCKPCCCTTQALRPLRTGCSASACCRPQVLILSPTRELAQQTEKATQAIGEFIKIRTHCCIGGTSLGAAPWLIEMHVKKGWAKAQVGIQWQQALKLPCMAILPDGQSGTAEWHDRLAHACQMVDTDDGQTFPLTAWDCSADIKLLQCHCASYENEGCS